MTEFVDNIVNKASGVVDAAKDFIDKGIQGLAGGGAPGTQQATGFSVQSIVTSLNQAGIANPSHFEVYITNGQLGAGNDQRHLAARAEAVEIPGRNLASLPVRFDGAQPVAEIVTGQVYNPVTVSFILSEDMREKEYFEGWQNSAVRTGAFTTNQANAKYTPNYYNSYVGTVEIRQYGSQGQLRSVHKLDKAYPKVLGGVQMNWGADGVARMSVTFMYERYMAVFNKQNQPAKGISGGFSLGPNGLAANLQVPGLGSFNVGGGRSAANLNIGGISKQIGKFI